MEMVKVECPCGAEHELPADLMHEIRNERPDMDMERVRIACPECAGKIAAALLPELLTEVRRRAEARELRQRMEENTEIDFDEIEHETDEAVMFVIADLLVWLPKSQIEFDRDDKTITLPVWLATEKGLI